MNQKKLAKHIAKSKSKDSRHLVSLLVQLEKSSRGKVSNMLEKAGRRPKKKK